MKKWAIGFAIIAHLYKQELAIKSPALASESFRVRGNYPPIEMVVLVRQSFLIQEEQI
jgi:hypothetical protein